MDKVKVWKPPLDVQRDERLRARILEVETIADAGLDANAVAATAEAMRC